MDGWYKLVGHITHSVMSPLSSLGQLAHDALCTPCHVMSCHWGYNCNHQTNINVNKHRQKDMAITSQILSCWMFAWHNCAEKSQVSCQNQVQLWVAKSMQMSPAFASGCYNNILICAFSSHVTGTSGWLPPQSSWDGGGTGLPFGWEAANDKEGRVYYVKWVVMTIMMREGSNIYVKWLTLMM